ncbi:unnamed protein product, partial [Rotaria sp. Silwood1]
IFPTLFPYGCGGLEDGSRPIQINFREHLRYLLSYADRRFEEHYSFIFVVFNILQRRTACFHAQLMTTRSWFQQSAQVLNSLSSEDVAAALINISKAPYSKVTDERINTLMKHIKIIGGHVMGSAHSRSALLLGGVLGPAKAYFGTVESQGRGSLHLHLLIWLNHEYTPAQLKEKIQNQDFRENLLKYLEDIIKEDLDSFRDETNDGTSTTSDDRTLIGEIGSTASEVIPPCRPTPNPALEDFDQTFRKDAVQLVIDKSDRHLLKNVTDPQGQQLPTEGTKMNERHTFDSVHPQSTSHLIIKRSIPVVPVLIGPQIPRREREETHERYCRALLTLFMPWRSVQNLCATNETWSEALEARRLLISPNSLKIIENIELLHECKHDRDEHLHQVLLEAQNDNSIDPILMPNYYEGDENAEEDDPEQLLQMLSIVNEITTNTYSALAATQEQRYVHNALQAIDNTDRFALLNDSRHIWHQNNYGTIHDINTFVVAHAHHSVMIKGWKRDIEGRRDEARNYLISGENTLEVRDDETQIEVVATEIPTSPIKTRATRVPPVTTTNAILFPTKQDIIRQFTLSTQQKYAFMIITSHLDGENHAYTGI